jgi:flagellar transcriptional activator FlhD
MRGIDPAVPWLTRSSAFVLRITWTSPRLTARAVRPTFPQAAISGTSPIGALPHPRHSRTLLVHAARSGRHTARISHKASRARKRGNFCIQVAHATSRAATPCKKVMHRQILCMQARDDRGGAHGRLGGTVPEVMYRFMLLGVSQRDTSDAMHHRCDPTTIDLRQFPKALPAALRINITIAREPVDTLCIGLSLLLSKFLPWYEACFFPCVPAHPNRIRRDERRLKTPAQHRTVHRLNVPASRIAFIPTRTGGGGATRRPPWKKMNVEELLEEIQDTNLSYLMLAQRLLKEDYAAAQFRLKLADDMAKLLMSLSTRQLSRLARTNQFLFRLCFESADQVQKIVGEKRDSAMMQTHASLLMARTAAAQA